jgi:hypothetical protein
MSTATLPATITDRDQSSHPAPADILWGLITGYQVSFAIYAATTLGIPGLLADRHRGYEDVAAETDADPDAVHRLLRLLAAAGVAQERADGDFELSDVGACLRTDVEHSMAAVALHFAGPLQTRTWMELEHTVRTGTPALLRMLSGAPAGASAPSGPPLAGGLPPGTMPAAAAEKHFVGAPPEKIKIFSEAMSFMGGQIGEALAGGAYDFDQVDTLVDVGGSYGALLAGILERYPHLHGTVFEVPGVAEGAREALAARGLAQRCDAVGGDFFAPGSQLPVGADAYLLKSVLHDFKDDQVVALLQNIRHAMTPSSRLLVAEPVVAKRVVASTAALRTAGSDVNMMVLFGSRERSEGEFRRLLGAGGFKVSSITLIDNLPSGMTGNFHLIEAAPVGLGW